MNRSSRTLDITGAPLIPTIIRYSIPVMLASLIQVLFNAVDIAVLGHMASAEAVASVGVTGSISGLIVVSFTGLSVGVNVILARAFGAKEYGEVRRTISTAILTAASIGAVIALAGILLARPMLGLVNCPGENLAGAQLYLTIYLLGAPAILIYNFCRSILSVSGDTVHPLIFIILSGILNVGLNIILCFILPEKILAVAVATLASQMLGAVLCIRQLCRVEDTFRLDIRRIRFDPVIFWRILRVGLPAAINHSLYAISNILISSTMNGFGSDAIAGNTAASSLEGLVNAIYVSFSSSASVFVGQNLGAGRNDRVKASILHCLWLSVLTAVIFGDGGFLFGRQLLGIYIPGQTAAIEYGRMRLMCICAVSFINSVNGTLGSSLQAFGYTTLSASISIVTVLVFRFFWMFAVYPFFETIGCLYFCYTCSWTLNLLASSTAFLIVWRRFRAGHLKQL